MFRLILTSSGRVEAKVDEEVYDNVDIEGTTKMDAKKVNAKWVDEKK